jgi:hypothetical protein
MNDGRYDNISLVEVLNKLKNYSEEELKITEESMECEVDAMTDLLYTAEYIFGERE